MTVDGSLYGGNDGIAAWGDGSSDGDNIEIKVGGDIYGKNAVADAVDGANIIIEGNAKGSRYGISASNYNDADDETSVTVKGDLEITTIAKEGDLQYGGAMGYNGGNVTVDGTIRIKDEASEGGWAADSMYGSTVKAGAIDTDAAGIAASSGTVIVEGDVESGDGYYSVGIFGDGSTVIIGNDLRTKDNGEVFIGVDNAGINSELAIGGKIENDDSGLRMKVDVDDDGNVKNFPEIVVGEITDPDKITIVDSNWDKVSEETKRQVLDNIKYIVNSNPDSMDGKGTFTITKLNGDKLSRDSSDKYDVTEKTEQIVVKIAVNDGYEVGSFSAGKNNTYVRNADGSYTITVADGGGINIEALIRAIEVNPDPVNPAPIDGSSNSNNSGKSSSSGVASGTWIGSGAFATFKKADGSTAKNEWLDINVGGSVKRYHFNAEGFITKGWYTENGASYYFYEQEGSEYGYMYTGWNLIDGKWYYFMPYDIIRNGETIKMGTLLKNTVTPDGYNVGDDGVWIE